MSTEEVRKAYKEYVRMHGHGPMYANCIIQWKDDAETSHKTIALCPYHKDTFSYEKDMKILFYCEDFEDFIRLFDKYNGEDFFVVRVESFSEFL